MKKSFLAAVGLILSLSSQAFAHDAKLHKGSTTDGKIFSVTAKGAEIQTDEEKLEVVFTDSTKIELEMQGKEGKKRYLKQGQHVRVAGHKLESGEISASEIMIHSDDDVAKAERNSSAGHTGIRFTGMPGFGGNDDDSWKLVTFVRHIPKLSPKEIELMKEINQMEAMGAK